MREMHLTQPGFTYSTCGRFTKKQRKNKKIKNILIKSCLHDNDIEMYSVHNKGKFVVAEGFIRTLKNKIYKYISSISKTEYIGK